VNRAVRFLESDPCKAAEVFRLSNVTTRTLGYCLMSSMNMLTREVSVELVGPLLIKVLLLTEKY
jgi:hypothetical protein